MGILLQHIMGGTVTPVQQAATIAYLQTHPLADNVGKSLCEHDLVDTAKAIASKVSVPLPGAPEAPTRNSTDAEPLAGTVTVIVFFDRKPIARSATALEWHSNPFRLLNPFQRVVAEE